MDDQITFRLMTIEDIDAILEIENKSFPNPWSRTAFYNELVTNHFATYMVVEVNGNIAGYCGVWVIVDEAHITNIALLPEYRGRQIGEMLLVKMVNLAKELGAEKVTLEVRVSNYIAQGLYRKLGFQDGGIRKNYYSDNSEDALVMWVNLNE
ncbi:ribosomal protein S18-alanine N-acetyltransferase [Pseudalkalibacillus caeni]|uniref:[Ribosomal protein bS18]-alanine N-acetyltransferase n=1 Tax=Exobacillus caeni TaxID=2574798 RepID=A0A5R9EYY3_9BACL|nr:ribosomal protein S18-alanine N-acetyltransferase [Pseudalkalibacillus caeni]TLS35280.1 ribosomal-protein-alanine N-acetyltransferase [Pseudalkalibacillus caeni]